MNLNSNNKVLPQVLATNTVGETRLYASTGGKRRRTKKRKTNKKKRGKIGNRKTERMHF
jgi:hypothetical protein